MSDNTQVEKEGFVLLTPMHRTMEARTAWCIEKAHQQGIPFIWSPHPGDALIGRARSILATWVLEKSPYQYAIFLDSDIVFEPENLYKLWQDLKSGYDLIGGVYTVRDAKQLAHYGFGGKIILDGKIREVEYLSTGFMGFTKSMLRKMVDELNLPLCHAHSDVFRCYPFFENYAYEQGKEYSLPMYNQDKWIYISEDWDFCIKARKVGIKAFLDTSILLGHQGNKVWTIGDLPPERSIPLDKASNLLLPKGAREHPSGLVLPNKKRGK